MEIDWETYILNMVHGARLYCMKESPDTLPQARRLLKKYVRKIFTILKQNNSENL